jgi:hypothetical protein
MTLPGVIVIFKLGTYSVVLLNDDGQLQMDYAFLNLGVLQRQQSTLPHLLVQCNESMGPYRLSKHLAAPAVNFTSFVQCNESIGPYRLSKHPNTLGASAPQMAKFRE